MIETMTHRHDDAVMACALSSSVRRSVRMEKAEARLEDPLEATALPSLLTSACVIALVGRFTWLGDLPLTKFAFFMLLPTLSALACLQDKRFLASFKRVFHWYVLRNGDASDDAQSSSMDALIAARNELFKSMTDRWPTKHTRNLSLSRYPPGMASETTLLSGGMNGPGNNSSSNGKSLYDQVRSQLKDHVFPSNLDAPIYFMDPNTGNFLRVNEQHKLVFTSSPDASCLFHVVKGKTHHWGFHSTIHQLYIGQNLIGKVVVNAKKMHSWEAFRVLERPDNDASDGGKTHRKTIYLVLCSARFGKGMWLGRHRRTPSNPTDTYLTKNFTNALALVYASDLSAFEYLSQRRASLTDRGSLVGSGPIELPPTVSPTSTTTRRSSTDPFGDSFQTPVLASAERARVVLPWIEDVTSKRFFELQDRQMIEVVSTTISRMTVREFIDFFIDQDARRMCHQKTSQAPAPPRNSSIGASIASSTPIDQRLSEWHLHPHFGFVRKLSYRPPASTPSNDGGSVPSLAASIAIDQYHSCSVNEKTMQKAVFRSKMYTLSIPNSNGFSIETVFEFQDTHDRDGTGIYTLTPLTPVLQFKCRTGVHFTRKTMFSPQIERGVVEGVKATCDLLLKLANEYRQTRGATPPSTGLLPSSTEGGRGSLTGSAPPESGLMPRRPREMFPPQTLAIEVINGMVNAVRGRTMSTSNSTTSRTRSSLIIQMPWTPAAITTPPQSQAQGTTVVGPRVGGFFESPPQTFECVVEEAIRGQGVTPSVVFDSLLSDECSFFHTVHKNSGTMDVDIGAWRVARFPVEGDQNIVSYVRKELFSMPLSGVPGLDVASIENYQYYALKRGGEDERLEFGMKIFAKELPDGDKFSIEVLVVVDKATSAEDSQCRLRVSYAIAKNSSVSSSNSDEDPLHTAVPNGTARGLRFVWKRIALVIEAATHYLPRISAAPTANGTSGEDIRHRLQFEGQLPSHDELSSKVIESIAALY